MVNGISNFNYNLKPSSVTLKFIFVVITIVYFMLVSREIEQMVPLKPEIHLNSANVVCR